MSTNEVVFEKRGENIRFKLPRWISREDYYKITRLNDVWYYKENKHFYLKPYMRPAVEQILVDLGFTIRGGVTAQPQSTTDQGESTSKVVESGIRIVSKISKLFNIKTHYICNICGKPTRWNYRRGKCPEHGFKSRPKKVWYFTGLLDIDGEPQLVLLYDQCFTGLLRKINMRKSDVADAVKGLSKDLYYEQLQQIKEKVIARLEELNREYGFVGDMVEWHTNGKTVTFFKAFKTMSERELKSVQGAEKFIAGEFETIKAIAEKIFPDHTLTVKNFGDAPIVTLRKDIGPDFVEVVIRAPVGEYGKAYHLQMKMNDVLMFPSEPVEVCVWGHTVAIWAWRIFHTKGWEERIRERLEYIQKIENQGFIILNRLKEIRKFKGRNLLAKIDLSDKVKNEILDEWEDGNTLIDFCNLIAKHNPTEALRAFRNAIETIYKTNYGRWLTQETDLTDDDIAEITLTPTRITT